MGADEKRSQRKKVHQLGSEVGDYLWQLRGQLGGQRTDMYQAYQRALGQQEGDYSNLMNQYQDFSKTGGFSPEDISNIRSRAVSPLRAAYSNAQRNVNRQRALQGGYSPGFGTLQARMAREQGQGMADASTNAEAAIAQMKQQGRLAGLGGASSLYGTSPGLIGTTGNQALTASGQLLGLADIHKNLNLGLLGAYQGATQLPGAWEGSVGRIGQVAGIAGNLFAPWMGGGSPAPLPSSRINVPGMYGSY